jgi:hypothetical protein
MPGPIAGLTIYANQRPQSPNRRNAEINKKSQPDDAAGHLNRMP